MSEIIITVSTRFNGGASTISALIEKTLIENGFSNIQVNDIDDDETYQVVKNKLDVTTPAVAQKTEKVTINQVPLRIKYV